MRYRDYLFGKPVSFMVAERASVQQVAGRLKARVGSRLWPFHFNKVIGRVGQETLSIEWSPSFFAFRSNMEPRLSGRLVSANAGVRFDGRIGAPFFVPVMLGFFAIIALVVATTAIRSWRGEGLFVLVFMAAWAAAPHIMAQAAARSSDERCKRLSDFVVAVGSGREPA